jgi:hypothetical protein
MSIGLGECKEKLRAEMIEVRERRECPVPVRFDTNDHVEDDTASRKAPRGSRLTAERTLEPESVRHAA